LGIGLFSCQKENNNLNNDELSLEKSAEITLAELNLESVTTALEYEAAFYANAEATLTRWWNVGKVWRYTNKLRYRVNECPDVSIESEDGAYPKTITLNYGDGTTLENGQVLSGVIVIEISGPRDSETYSREVVYTDFGVDSLTVNGNSLVARNRAEDEFRTFTTDMAFTLADGKVINRSSERVWEWLEGMDTDEDQTDDVIQITGVVNAENSDGDTYKKEIVEPLIRLGDCRFIVKGVVEIWLNETLISSLDYGNGDCNNMAILTKDGETLEIDLEKRKIKK
jgi:hypothetical protein